MGKVLVWLFLGSTVFAAFSVVIGLVHMVRDLLVLVRFFAPSQILSNALILPPALAFTGFWFQFAIIYFFIIVPLGILALLTRQLIVRNQPTRWKRPAPLDWRTQRLAVVLTAYNDEQSIGLAVDEFKDLPQVATVIVVDNNSKDRTTQVALEHGAVVVNEPRQGYGYACIGGMRYALEHTDADAIVLCEGDHTFYGDDLAKFLPYLADCDLVVGTRNTRVLTREGSQMDWFMAWGNLYLAILIRLRYWNWAFLGRVQLTDVGCTYRVIRREALARIIDKLTVGSHHFSPHMILVVLREYLAVTEVPIKFRRRVGVSKGAGGNKWTALRVGLAMIGSIATH
jgi:cellulose synthase/poly-beta-1,6-N-acetylglucosamine synthase-like glycosyltransferase